MALVRALNTAVGGLRSQQTRIDQIGDNLANSTTTGFKAGRVEFHTLLSQTMSFGSAPQGQLGGIDPIQIGLGTTVAETSRNFNQGELQVTGINSDLAVDGAGFFIMRDVTGQRVLSRDGSLSINPLHQLHNPANGMIVQGLMADLTNFTLVSGGPVVNITIPVGNVTTAVATATSSFDGNLNGGGPQALNGTVLESEVYVNLTTSAAAVSSTPLIDLGRTPATGGPNVDFGLDLGDTIFVNVKKGGRPLPQKRFLVGTSPNGFDGYGTTFGQLISFLNRATGINTGVSELLTSAVRDSDNNPTTPGTFGTATALVTTGTTITGVRQTGVDFGSEGVRVGDILRFNTGQGAGQIARVSSISTTSTTNDTINFSAALSSTIPQPAVGDQFSVHEPPRVAIGNGTSGVTTNGSAAGVVRVAGNAGLANQLTDLVLATSDGINMGPFFTRNNADGESTVTNATFFDSNGAPHVVELTFVLETKGGANPSTNTSPGNNFRFFAESTDSRFLSGTSIAGTDRVVGTGIISFTTGGQFMAQNPGAAVSLSIPNTGAATPFVVSPQFSSLTGFSDSQSQVFMDSQDGFGLGTLSDFNIQADGTVIGLFTNGLTRPIARVLLGRVANNNGLSILGQNNYGLAANSGTLIVGKAGTLGLGQVRGGLLEASNVDFAQEFTNLIVSQRAFQADARVITTADAMLDELVNIVR